MNISDNEEVRSDVKRQIEEILKKHQIVLDKSPEKESQPDLPVIENNNSDIFSKTIKDKEIRLDPNKTIMSKTDTHGIIEYANEYFIEISGYSEYELMGKPHNFIRHPDMPGVIFKVMWDRLKHGDNIYALVKNLAKDGRYYWVLTNFETKYDENNKIVAYYARRKAAPTNAIYQIEKIYKTLRAIEKNQGLEVAEKYFSGMLEEKNLSYDEFIMQILNVNETNIGYYFNDEKQVEKETKKKSIINRLFKR